MTFASSSHGLAPHLMVHCGDRNLERIMQKKAYSATTDRVALNFGLTIPSVRPRSSSPAPSSKYISSAPNGAFARRRRRLVMHEWRGESGEEEEEFIPVNRVG